MRILDIKGKACEVKKNLNDLGSLWTLMRLEVVG